MSNQEAKGYLMMAIRDINRGEYDCDPISYDLARALLNAMSYCFDMCTENEAYFFYCNHGVSDFCKED